MNILFIFPSAPKTSPFRASERFPPLGIGSMIAVLRQAGHRADLADLLVQPYTALSSERLRSGNIEAVGVYANSVCYNEAIQLLDRLETWRNEGQWKGKLLVGGPHANLLPETFPAYVDHVVAGEGEEVILRFANGETLPRMIRTPRIKDLDALPLQPWDLFTAMPYDRKHPWVKQTPLFALNTSRGCPFSCGFCSARSLIGQRYTYQSGQRIMEEVEYLVKHHNAKALFFREDNFTCQPKRLQSFCEMLIQRHPEMKWICESRVDSLQDESLVALMARSGCRAVFLGIESGSSRMLEIMKKGITVEQIYRANDLCKKHGILRYCSFVAGYPGERLWDIAATYRIIRHLKPDFHSLNVFVGIPGSAMYEQIIQDGNYEYKTDNGVIYLPGYDIRSRFFSGIEISQFLSHPFKRRDWQTRILQGLLPVRRAWHWKNARRQSRES